MSDLTLSEMLRRDLPALYAEMDAIAARDGPENTQTFGVTYCPRCEAWYAHREGQAEAHAC